jgi:plasmid replication initiation protein
MTAEDLLVELRTSRTDLARLVEAVSRDQFSKLVVSQRSVDAWERREPETWLKVSGWLAARGVSILLI